MSARERMAHAALAIVALGSAACTMSTSTVRVKDTANVSMESVEGKPVVPVGQAAGLAAKGEYFVPFKWVQYQIHGTRDAQGVLGLTCDACEKPQIDLLDATGHTRETWSWRVAIAPENVTVSYEDECMQSHRSFCDAKAPVRLSIPKDEVIEVRRKVEPIRPIGYLFTGVSALALGALAYTAISDHDAAPYAAAFSVPFLAFGGVGLWEPLAPAKEQVWTPSQER